MNEFPISLVILESMYGAGRDGKAPLLFQINPRNFSGRRLYKLFGDQWFVVGDACPGLQPTARHHGTPCPIHLAEVIRYARHRRYALPLILVCGVIAQATFEKLPAGVVPESSRVLYMPHPAARAFWNAGTLRMAQIGIQGPETRCRLTAHGWLRMDNPFEKKPSERRRCLYDH